MKKVIVLTLVLLCLFFMLSTFTLGQEFGSIKGEVHDQDGDPLPGVLVTLTGSKIPLISTITSERGNFRFLNLTVAKDYQLKFELDGFTTVIRENIVVSFNRDVNLNITMELLKILDTKISI